jgi:hypothetical protein
MKATKVLTMKVQRHRLCKGLATGLCGRRSDVQSSVLEISTSKEFS